jgi:hypothetical protein
MKKIIGLYGCYCHSFKTWKECDFYHNQKFFVGQKVTIRCTGKKGVINEVQKGGFVIVKTGELQRHLEQHHAAELELMTYQLLLF